VDIGRQKSHNIAGGIGAHAGQPLVMALRLDGQIFNFQQCKGVIK
jgi:hypothetical protein